MQKFKQYKKCPKCGSTEIETYTVMNEKAITFTENFPYSICCSCRHKFTKYINQTKKNQKIPGGNKLKHIIPFSIKSFKNKKFIFSRYWNFIILKSMLFLVSLIYDQTKMNKYSIARMKKEINNVKSLIGKGLYL